jgi:hypothetical protein
MRDRARYFIQSLSSEQMPLRHDQVEYPRHLERIHSTNYMPFFFVYDELVWMLHFLKFLDKLFYRLIDRSIDFKNEQRRMGDDAVFLSF